MPCQGSGTNEKYADTFCVYIKKKKEDSENGTWKFLTFAAIICFASNAEDP